MVRKELKAVFDRDLDTLMFYVVDPAATNTYKILKHGIVLEYNHDDILQTIIITGFSNWHNTIDRLVLYLTTWLNGPPSFVIEDLLRSAMSPRRTLH